MHLARLSVLHRLNKRALSTIYLGGGTPSLWPVSRLRDLLHNIVKQFNVEDGAEISLEANPDTLSLGKLRGLRAAGFNRLSLGVQSFSEESLSLLGRLHKPGQISKAVAWARRAGFSNLSLDMMYGLPKQTPAQAMQDLEQLLALGPEHISLYQLTLNPGTPLGKRYQPDRAPMPDEDTVIQMEDLLYAACQATGFARYEVSNFARSGFACRHNASTWRGGDYLALGPGAHGHMGGRRFANLYDLNSYINAWQNQGGLEFEEVLSGHQRAAELFILGLRTVVGVDLQQVSRLIGQPALDYYAPALAQLESRQWARLNYPWLQPTSLGLRMADSAAELFLDDKEED